MRREPSRPPSGPARLHGKDLRTLGSCNLGATNVQRVLGWGAAIPVGLFDIFKGFAPVWWFPQLDDQTAPWWTVAYGAAAIVGHVFSFWVRFRGGKGVATSAGVLLAVAPLAAAVGLGVLAGRHSPGLANGGGRVDGGGGCRARGGVLPGSGPGGDDLSWC